MIKKLEDIVTTRRKILASSVAIGIGLTIGLGIGGIPHCRTAPKVTSIVSPHRKHSNVETFSYKGMEYALWDAVSTKFGKVSTKFPEGQRDYGPPTSVAPVDRNTFLVSVKEGGVIPINIYDSIGRTPHLSEFLDRPFIAMWGEAYPRRVQVDQIANKILIQPHAMAGGRYPKISLEYMNGLGNRVEGLNQISIGGSVFDFSDVQLINGEKPGEYDQTKFGKVVNKVWDVANYLGKGQYSRFPPQFSGVFDARDRITTGLIAYEDRVTVFVPIDRMPRLEKLASEGRK
jgi:hypothetical protein